MNKKSILNEKVKTYIAMQNLIEEEHYKKIKMAKIRKITFSFVLSIIVVSGIAYAVNYTYKIWKEPIKVESEEQIIDENKKDENISESEKNKAISKETITEKAKDLLIELGYDDSIYNIDLKRSYAETYDTYYEVKTTNNYTSGIEFNFNAENGRLEYFIDRDLEKKFNNIDSTTEEQIKKEIIEKSQIFMKEETGYEITQIEKIPVYSNQNIREENWTIRYSKIYDNLPNSYDTLEISLYCLEGELKIYKYAKYDKGYEFRNDEVTLSKEEAIEIAKNKNTDISSLEIKNIEADLEIRPMNAFIYEQEETGGKEDGFVRESENGRGSIVYNQYISEKLLRKVWNVKINYEVDIENLENINNINEIYGREYYVDATTGEIIGGKWKQE